jgi:transcription-repair coupling factor (superfamily II helicase)
MIDRFGQLPEPTENLLTLIQIKLNAKTAHIAKIDVGPRGALVAFWNDTFPKVDGLLAYVARLGDTAKLRPDMRLSINRAWADPKARLHGILQLSRGLAKVAG